MISTHKCTANFKMPISNSLFHFCNQIARLNKSMLIVNVFELIVMICFILAVIFFTEMLGPEEDGKISHVTEIEISERATGKK